MPPLSRPWIKTTITVKLPQNRILFEWCRIFFRDRGASKHEKCELFQFKVKMGNFNPPSCIFDPLVPLPWKWLVRGNSPLWTPALYYVRIPPLVEESAGFLVVADAAVVVVVVAAAIALHLVASRTFALQFTPIVDSHQFQPTCAFLTFSPS